MKIKRIRTLLSCSLLFLLLLTGCRKVVPYSEFIAASSSSSGNKVNLSNGISVSIVLSPKTDTQQYIAEHLITNSKEISVSCSSIPDQAEILLSLYDESQPIPLLSTTLSSEERSTTFRPLTSVKLYKLIAVAKNGPYEDEIFITVTD